MAGQIGVEEKTTRAIADEKSQKLNKTPLFAEEIQRVFGQRRAGFRIRVRSHDGGRRMTSVNTASHTQPAPDLAAFVAAMCPWMILFSFWGFVRVSRNRRLEKAARLMAESAERFAREEDEAAARKSSQVLALDPRYAQAFILRGIILSQTSRFMEAIVDFDRAVALMPQHVLAIYHRATAKHCLGDLDGAIADYDRVMELEPGCADSLPGLRRSSRFAAGRIF